MRTKIMKKTFSHALVALATICVGVSLMRAQMTRAQKMRAEKQSDPGAASGSQTCPDDDSGLKLPAGFCATVFADGIGHVRHMVVAPNGVLYVNTYDANETNQIFSPAERYATGIRNAEGFAIGSSGRL